VSDPIAVARRRLDAETEHKGASLADLLAPFRAGRPAFKGFDSRRGVEEGFKQSVWVFRAVRAKMHAAASVPIMVRRRTPGGSEPDPDSPLQRLLDALNPFMSFQDLIETAVAHLELAGNALWTKVGGSAGRRAPKELWPVDPGPISVVPSKEKFIAEYVFDEEGVNERFAPDEVVHFMYSDPSNPRWGMGPLQAAARAVDTDTEQARWQFGSLRNRAVPDGAFVLKGLGGEQLEEARGHIRDRATGREHARKPLVLSGTDVSWLQLSLSPAEMDFLESRKLTRQEIVAAFGVPLAIAGPLEDTTLANFETARRKFWEDEIVPLLRLVETTMQRSLVPDFPDGEGDLEVAFDLSNVTALQQSTESRVQQLERLVEQGVPLNRAIELVELPLDPVDGGDVGTVPANRVPLTFASGGGLDRGDL